MRAQLVVFAAVPLVGDLVSSLPRIPAYRSLTVIQTAAHLVSAAMVTYAFTVPRTSSASALLLQPWFAVLVASTAVDRLSCVSLGVIAECDFVVQVHAIAKEMFRPETNSAHENDEISDTVAAELASRGRQADRTGAGERGAQQGRSPLRGTIISS